VHSFWSVDSLSWRKSRRGETGEPPAAYSANNIKIGLRRPIASPAEMPLAAGERTAALARVLP
jgi:hypothetical protein